MAELSSETVQTACVAIDGQAVLIEARAAELRSDLALRLIDRGAALVADDCTFCRREGRELRASAPAGGGGRIEIRGIGTVEMEHVQDVPVRLLAVILESAPRFPEDARTRRIAGIDVPVLALGALELAAPIKVELALRKAAR